MGIERKWLEENEGEILEASLQVSAVAPHGGRINHYNVTTVLCSRRHCASCDSPGKVWFPGFLANCPAIRAPTSAPACG